MIKPFDSHTHVLDRKNALINADIDNFEPCEGLYYSLGIHPWATADKDAVAAQMKKLKEYASNRQVVAIGEAGIDKLRGGDIEFQKEIFRFQANLASDSGLPMILHVVKAYPEIIQLKKELNPDRPWIIHGFRGKPQLASELLSHGFYLSLGDKYNKATAEIIPADRLLVETDMSDVKIEDVAKSFPQLDMSLPYKLFNIGNSPF